MDAPGDNLLAEFASIVDAVQSAVAIQRELAKQNAEIDGVSSLCRFWHLDIPGYLALLHFFRSSAWSLTGLLSCW